MTDSLPFLTETALPWQTGPMPAPEKGTVLLAATMCGDVFMLLYATRSPRSTPGNLILRWSDIVNGRKITDDVVDAWLVLRRASPTQSAPDVQGA